MPCDTRFDYTLSAMDEYLRGSPGEFRMVTGILWAYRKRARDERVVRHSHSQFKVANRLAENYPY